MIAERFDAFLFDLDGVVYLGDELLPGSEEALARLRGAGKEVRFLTNDPRPTRRQVCRRLAGMRVQVDAEEVITSGWATASYLLQNGVESAYVIGSRGAGLRDRRGGSRGGRQGALRGGRRRVRRPRFL